ncbi:unnamed protein product [Closterium sp. Naga37s-1]|nr:unnamed protein product [Closterium sp. Naga37s-1]
MRVFHVFSEGGTVVCLTFMSDWVAGCAVAVSFVRDEQRRWVCGERHVGSDPQGHRLDSAPTAWPQCSPRHYRSPPHALSLSSPTPQLHVCFSYTNVCPTHSCPFGGAVAVHCCSLMHSPFLSPSHSTSPNPVAVSPPAPHLLRLHWFLAHSFPPLQQERILGACFAYTFWPTDSRLYGVCVRAHGSTVEAADYRGGGA